MSCVRYDALHELFHGLHTLETQLAGAAARSPQPQTGEATGDTLSPEHVNEGSLAGRDPLVAETRDTLSSGLVPGAVLDRNSSRIMTASHSIWQS